MSSIVLPTGTRGWNRMPGLRRRRDLLFGFRAAGLELVDLATGQPISFSRASPGGLVPVLGGSGASRGTVLSGPHAHNVPRFAMLDRDGDGSPETPALRLEGSSTNRIRNPRAEGAMVGTIGSGGALPTFWAAMNTAGLTWEVVAAGIEDGVSYVDVRLHGTPSQTFAQMRFDGTTAIAAAPGETWTGSCYVRRVGGSMAGIGVAWVRIQERDASGAFLRQSQSVFDLDDSSRLAGARRTYTHTVSDPNAAAIVLMFGIVGMTVGTPVDVTFRIGGPQLERSAVASSLILPPSGSPAASSRALDVLTAPWAHGLISFTGYVRFIETGGAQLSGATVALWFGAGGGEIWLRSSASTPTYVITLRDSRGASAEVHTTPGVTTQVGQLVELMPQIEVSSQGVRARLIQAVDGGDPVTSSWTGYVQADWVPTTLRLVSRAIGSNQGQLDLLDLVVLRGAGWTMDAVRNRFGIAV